MVRKPALPVLSYRLASTVSMLPSSSTTRFITARTERGSRQLSQSRVSTLLRSICEIFVPCKRTYESNRACAVSRISAQISVSCVNVALFSESISYRSSTRAICKLIRQMISNNLQLCVGWRLYQHVHALLFELETRLGQHQQQIGWARAGDVRKAGHHLRDVTQEANQ